MKKKLLVLLASLALIAGACGDDEATTTTTADSGGGETTTTEAPAPASEAGSGGELILLQWQAPSQANSLLSSGTKDLLAGSLVLEPLAETAPDGSLIPALAAEIPTEAMVASPPIRPRSRGSCKTTFYGLTARH